MMKNFTIVKSFALLIVLCLSSFAAQAQTNAMVFKIASPAAAAGTYGLLRSSFGDQGVDEIKATAIKLTDPAKGCTPLANSMTGSFAFVDRGDCEFAEKVQSAQNAGAVAVIICNNENELIAPGPGVINTGASITVKSFMMDKGDCDKIKVSLAAGAVNGDLVVRQCEPVPPANAIYSEDFDGGLNGWTINTEDGKGWGWTADGDCQASFMPSPCNMNTPTICNGAVAINSNALDVSGACQATCPSSLFSPNIDLSNVTITALNLQFSQSIREFNSTYFVITSYDNGATYPDTFAINNDIFSNDNYTDNQLVRVGLCGIDPSIKQIKFQILINANYYFWGIDDVFLVNEAYADPQANNNFWAVAPSLKTPRSQATEVPLLSDVRNNGAVPSPNTVLTAKVNKVTGTGALGAQVYTQDLSYGTLQECEQIENVNFATKYQEPSEAGRYRLTYTINSDNNKVRSNDARSSDFFMTDNIFSNGLTEAEFGRAYLRDFIGGVNPAFIGANVNFWSLGTNYYFPKGSVARIKEFRFGVDTTVAFGAYSAQLTCSVYKILNNDTDAANITSDERVLVGKGFAPDGAEELFVDNTTAGRRRSSFNITDLNGGELILEDNTGYLFMVDVRQFSGTKYFPFLSFNPNSSNNTLRWSYTEATNLAFTQEGINRYFGTVVSRGATDTDVPAERSLATNFFKRMYSQVVVDDITGTKDPLAETALNIHPNPATTDLFVDLNLAQISKTVKVEMFDIAGKKVISQSFQNARTEALKINVASLNTGMYVTKITTDEGFITKKVMIKN
jgi:hypothetical protein